MIGAPETMKGWQILLIFIVALLLAAGCSPSEENTQTVATALEVDDVSAATSGAADPISSSGTEEPTEVIETESSGGSSTIVPSASATSSQATVHMATATPEATPELPATQATPIPTINYFRSDVEVADPGDTITLEWMTTGAVTVTLWHLAPTGQLGRFWDVSPNGSFDYSIDPIERNYSRFALFASIDADNWQMATLSITLNCLDDWFFTNAPDICPARAALFSEGAVQYFENGLMIWMEAEDHIYVLFGDTSSPKWKRFVDSWEEGEPEDDPTITPPEGLYQPVRGFGLIWREEPGVRERLGWAVEEEAGFSTAVQRTSYAKYNETYVLAPDGQIWHLLAEGSGWEMIAPE